MSRAKRPSARRAPSWLRGVSRSLPLLVGAALLTLALETLGGLRKTESATLDLQAFLQSALALHTKPSQVALVLIKPEDWRTQFGGKSPLDAGKLQQLIDSVAAARPQAIVVDFDTANPAFAALHPPLAGPPVIWARLADYSHVQEIFLVKPFLGGAQPRLPSGVALQKVDADGSIRRYQRLYPTDLGPLPSLPWATVSAVRGLDPVRSTHRRDELFLRFGLARPVTQTSSYVLREAQGKDWGVDNFLTGKIVVLGGSYSADDEHETPLGWQSGSEIVAQAIETELEGDLVSPVSRLVLIGLQIVQGVLFLLLFQALRFRKALALSLLAIPALAALFSVLTFATPAYWGHFAPVLLAVLGQQIYEQAKKYRSSLVESAAEALGDETRNKHRKKKQGDHRP